MANNSATGGYLSPASSPLPLEGQALQDFFQAWVVGLTGLPGRLVRPRYLAEPPVIPPADTAWAAVGVMTGEGDTFPFIGHDPSGDGTSFLQRQEVLEVLASFYDTGQTGLADYYMALFRDGSAIPQNLEAFTQAHMGLIGVGSPVQIPSQFKTRWLYRVDLPLQVHRQVERTYPVLNVSGAGIELVTDEGQERRIVVPPT